MSDVSGACERIDFFVCRCEHPRCLFGSYRHDEKRALWIACVRRVRNAVNFFLGREKVMNAPFCSILCSVAFAVRMSGLSFSFRVTAGS